MERSARLPYIDALRGYAILLVIMVHASQLVLTLPWGVRELANQGARGVQLFFVASALTLMQSWHRRRDGTQHFYLRRLFRIAPMFWLATIFFAGLAWWRGADVTWPKVLASLTFLFGLRPDTINAVVPGGWSIADKMLFYAIFPLLVALIRGWPLALVLLVGSIFIADAMRPLVADAVAAATPANRDQAAEFAWLWLPNQLPAFLVGFLVFHLTGRWRVPAAAARCGLVCAVLAMAWLTYHSVGIQNHLAFAIAFGTIAFYLPHAQLSVLVNPVISWVGKISFSAYIWHFALIYLLVDLYSALGRAVDGVHGLAIAFLALALPTFLCATLTYRLIELPMIRLGSFAGAPRASEGVKVIA